LSISILQPLFLGKRYSLNAVMSFYGTAQLIWHKISFPFGFAPAAMHQIAHPLGEVGTTRAAAKKGIPMTLSTYSNCSMEDVFEAGKGSGIPFAFQLIMFKDKELTLSLIKRAEGTFNIVSLILVETLIRLLIWDLFSHRI
jgi:hypothetical protein